MNDQGRIVVLMGQKVIDCTNFKHPGGIDKISSRAGRDVLQDFMAMKHSQRAEAKAMNMIIGQLQKEDQPTASNFLSVGVNFGPASFGPGGMPAPKEKTTHEPTERVSFELNKQVSFGPSQEPQQEVEEGGVSFGLSQGVSFGPSEFGPVEADQKQMEKREEEIKEAQEEDSPKKIEPTIIDGVRYIEQEELQQHMDEDDLWILIHGKVYDTTNFHHPGGKDIMMDHVGEDATQAFEDQNHTDLAYDEMKDLYVGEFRGELKQRAKERGPPGSLKNQLVAFGFMIVIFALFMQYIWLSPSPEV